MTGRAMTEAVAAALFEDEQGEPWAEATTTARWDYRQRADVAIRAMDRSDAMDVFLTMANVLDGLMPTLKHAAHGEAKREAGKPMRKITKQRRYEAARRSVARANVILGRKGND